MGFRTAVCPLLHAVKWLSWYPRASSFPFLWCWDAHGPARTGQAGELHPSPLFQKAAKGLAASKRCLFKHARGALRPRGASLLSGISPLFMSPVTKCATGKLTLAHLLRRFRPFWLLVSGTLEVECHGGGSVWDTVQLLVDRKQGEGVRQNSVPRELPHPASRELWESVWKLSRVKPSFWSPLELLSLIRVTAEHHTSSWHPSYVVPIVQEKGASFMGSVQRK